jgi:hypothetical protein
MSLMMMADPITPPPELVEQWLSEHYGAVSVAPGAVTSHVATEAARWGADQELEACCQALRVRGTRMRCMEANQTIEHLRAARRPEPPSLKEQALEALQFVDEKLDLPLHNHCNAIHTIRRALEALDD